MWWHLECNSVAFKVHCHAFLVILFLVTSLDKISFWKSALFWTMQYLRPKPSRKMFPKLKLLPNPKIQGWGIFIDILASLNSQILLEMVKIQSKLPRNVMTVLGCYIVGMKRNNAMHCNGRHDTDPWPTNTLYCLLSTVYRLEAMAYCLSVTG